MKRILVLLLAVCLVLGLSATALAAGESIGFDGTSTNEGAAVANGESVRFIGTVTGLDGTSTYKLTCNGVELGLTVNANSGSFDYSTTASGSAGNPVDFNFSLTNTTAGGAEVAIAKRTVKIKNNQASIISIAPTYAGSAANPSSTSITTIEALSSATYVLFPASAITVSPGATYQVSAGGNNISTGGSLDLGTVGPETNTSFSVSVTSEDQSLNLNYNFIIKRLAAPIVGNKDILTGISLKNGYATVGNEISGTISNNYSATITVPNTYTGPNTVTVNWTLAGTALPVSATWGGSPVASGGSVSLPAAGGNTTLVITAKASDGNNYSATITINRQQPAVTNLATGLTLRTTSDASSAQVASLSATITSANYTTTRSLQIPASYSGTTSFYVHASPYSGVSYTPAPVSIPAATNSTSGNINIGGYNVPVSITREAVSTTTYMNSVTLRSGSFSGTQVGAAVGAVTSANISTARTITIPASLKNTTTFYAVVALPSGIISNATITGTNTSVSRSSNNITLSIPSTTTTATLNITVPGYASAIPITINRETNTNILKSLTFTYSGTNLYTLGAVAGSTTQNINLNTSYTSATLKWELADGATFYSGKWGNATLTANNGVGGYSANLPSSGSTALELNITASNGTTYKAIFNVSRSGNTTNTLNTLYIKNRETTSLNSGYLC